MYDFLYSEVWWMETIIAAGISAITALIVAWLGYQGKIKDILSALSSRKEEHSNLSDEHNRLSDEHNRLSDEHNRLLDVQSRLYESQARMSEKQSVMMDNVNKILEDTFRRQGKDIATQDAIKHTVDLQNLLLSQEEYIYRLKTECESVKEENAKLKEINKQLKTRIKSYENELENNHLQKDDDYEL